MEHGQRQIDDDRIGPPRAQLAVIGGIRHHSYPRLGALRAMQTTHLAFDDLPIGRLPLEHPHLDQFLKIVQADRYNAAFNAVVKALTPSVCIAPDRPRLIERKLDDECGCPEELWEAFGAHLQMHLAAGAPSNAHADYGDEGEAEMEVTAATHDLARAAIFGWARELERPGAARGAPTGAVKAHA